MNLINVQTTENRHGLLCEDLDGVKRALTLYSEGVPRAAFATEDRLVRDGGGMALALGAAVLPSEATFLGRLLKQLEADLKARGRCHLDYDYDGMGTAFFKSGVDVTRYDQGYLLSISAAYVGDKGIRQLAEYLETQLELRSATVTLTVDSDGEEFEIDFVDITSKLAGSDVLLLDPFHIAETIAAGTSAWRSEANQPGTYFFEKGPIVVSISLSHVDHNIYRLGEKFTVNGTKISGPRAQGCYVDDEYDPEAFDNPLVNIGLLTKVQHENDKIDRPPVFDRELEKEMLELRDAIAACFQ